MKCKSKKEMVGATFDHDEERQARVQRHLPDLRHQDVLHWSFGAGEG